jgi:hypothetical protein
MNPEELLWLIRIILRQMKVRHVSRIGPHRPLGENVKTSSSKVTRHACCSTLTSIGRMLVKIMKINKESEDGYNLLNWKLPGQGATTRMAGDFAGRCFDVLSKRPMRTDPGVILC